MRYTPLGMVSDVFIQARIIPVFTESARGFCWFVANGAGTGLRRSLRADRNKQVWRHTGARSRAIPVDLRHCQQGLNGQAFVRRFDGEKIV